MKRFELTYLCLEPFLPPLHKKVRRRLRAISSTFADRPRILDVGGRKSHYTIGVPASVTIIDLPKETDIQQQLNLGINREIKDLTFDRRSNIESIVLGDMTNSSLPGETFDCVVAVEVLEHVQQDELFVREVHRVLKPNGLFLMTTPNGDSVRNTNPDHIRHYQRSHLSSLLALHFAGVEVEYAIQGGVFRTYGLRSWSPKRPVRTALSMFGNVINTIQSAKSSLKDQWQGTRHLIATARKQN